MAQARDDIPTKKKSVLPRASGRCWSARPARKKEKNFVIKISEKNA